MGSTLFHIRSFVKNVIKRMRKWHGIVHNVWWSPGFCDERIQISHLKPIEVGFEMTMESPWKRVPTYLREYLKPNEGVGLS